MVPRRIAVSGISALFVVLLLLMRRPSVAGRKGGVGAEPSEQQLQQLSMKVDLIEEELRVMKARLVILGVAGKGGAAAGAAKHKALAPSKPGAATAVIHEVQGVLAAAQDEETEVPDKTAPAVEAPDKAALTEAAASGGKEAAGYGKEGEEVIPIDQVPRVGGMTKSQQLIKGSSDGPMLVIATTQAEPRPGRPLKQEKREIQLNTLRAMGTMQPKGLVVPYVLAETEAWAAEARAEGARVISQYETRTSMKFPTFRGIMKQMETVASAQNVPFFGYVNGDIMFTEDLLVTLRLVQQAQEAGFFGGRPVFIIGQRMNFPAKDHIKNLNHDKRCALTKHLHNIVQDGTLFCTCAIDYFIGTPGVFPWDDMEDYVVGSVAYDQWIIKTASMRQSSVAMIDATATLHALHQSGHDGNSAGHRETPAKTHNMRMWERGQRKHKTCSHTGCAQFKTEWVGGYPTLVMRGGGGSEKRFVLKHEGANHRTYNTLPTTEHPLEFAHLLDAAVSCNKATSAGLWERRGCKFFYDRSNAGNLAQDIKSLCTLENGVMIGEGSMDEGVAVESGEDCRGQCAMSPKCVAYTFAAVHKLCYRKDNARGHGPKENRVSGVCSGHTKPLVRARSHMAWACKDN